MSDTEGLPFTAQRKFARFDGQTGKFNVSETSKLWHWIDRRHGKELKVKFFVSLFRI